MFPQIIARGVTAVFKQLFFQENRERPSVAYYQENVTKGQWIFLHGTTKVFL